MEYFIEIAKERYLNRAKERQIMLDELISATNGKEITMSKKEVDEFIKHNQ